MRRRLFNVMLLVSLMLCITVSVAWVKSYQTGYEIVRFRERHVGNEYRFSFIYLMTSAGGVRLGCEWSSDTWRSLGYIGPVIQRFDHPWYPAFDSLEGQYKPRFHFGDFVADWRSGTSSRLFLIILPYWAILGALGSPIVPVASRKLLRMHHRHRANVCAQCGYDLRATPDRCPECGTMSKQL